MSFRAPDSLTEKIAQHLGEKIIIGDLRPGDRIQEIRFAKEMGISRGSIREAFLILESRYLINILPRRGAVVSQMSATQVKDIYEAMTVLLTSLILKAVANWQEKDLTDFQALLTRMNSHASEGNVMDYHNCSFEFYRMAYRFFMNGFLEDTLENLLPTIRRTYYLALISNKDEVTASLDFFNKLFMAVLARDGSSATQLLRDFAQHQCDVVLKVMKVSR